MRDAQFVLAAEQNTYSETDPFIALVYPLMYITRDSKLCAWTVVVLGRREVAVAKYGRPQSGN